jgi:hypothetical protein
MPTLSRNITESLVLSEGYWTDEDCIRQNTFTKIGVFVIEHASIWHASAAFINDLLLKGVKHE